MRKIDRVGESFVNQQGSPFTIIEYNSTKDVVVEFQDEFKARVHTTYHHCLRGGIKNPYAPSVFGVGCLGELSSNVKININGKKMRESIHVGNQCCNGAIPQDIKRDIPHILGVKSVSVGKFLRTFLKTYLRLKDINFGKTTLISESL